jgi:hypothetical protein
MMSAEDVSALGAKRMWVVSVRLSRCLSAEPFGAFVLDTSHSCPVFLSATFRLTFDLGKIRRWRRRVFSFALAPFLSRYWPPSRTYVTLDRGR